MIVASYIELFGRSLEWVEGQLSTMPFDSGKRQCALSAALLSSALELAYSIYQLSNLGYFNIVPILLRSQLEAFCDLLCLTRDPDYLKSMLASDLDQVHRKLREASGNPLLSSIPALPWYPDGVAKVREELRDLARCGIKPLKIRERFDRSGMSDVYVAVYWSLCLHSHHSLGILEDRHLKEEGSFVSVTAFVNPPVEQVSRHLDSSISMLLDAVAAFSTLLGVALAENSFREELLSLRRSCNKGQLEANPAS